MALKTNTSKRYTREWLASQTAADYLKYNSENKKFSLTIENPLVLADEEGPIYLLGRYHVLRSIFKDEDNFANIFKTSEGLR